METKVEKVSGYELGKMFEKAAALCNSIPAMIVNECDYVANDHLRKLHEQLRAVLGSVSAFDELVGKWEQGVVDRYDALYVSVTKKRNEVAAKIKDIEPLPEVSIPYNFKSLMEIAERCDSYTDEQWQRVIELAKAFKPEWREPERTSE